MTKYYCDKCSIECTNYNNQIRDYFIVKRFEMFDLKGSILCLCDGCLLDFLDYLPDDSFSKELRAYALSCSS